MYLLCKQSKKNHIFTLAHLERPSPPTFTHLVFTMPVCSLMQISSLHEMGSFAHMHQALCRWRLDKQNSVCVWHLVSHCYIYYRVMPPPCSHWRDQVEGSPWVHLPGVYHHIRCQDRQGSQQVGKRKQCIWQTV